MALKTASESRERFPPARPLYACRHHEQTFHTANYCLSSLNYCRLSLAMMNKTEPRADSASFHRASQTRGNSSSGRCWVSGKWGEGRLPPAVRKGEEDPSCTNSVRDVHRRTAHTRGEVGRIKASAEILARTHHSHRALVQIPQVKWYLWVSFFYWTVGSLIVDCKWGSLE